MSEYTYTIHVYVYRGGVGVGGIVSATKKGGICKKKVKTTDNITTYVGSNRTYYSKQIYFMSNDNNILHR